MARASLTARTVPALMAPSSGSRQLATAVLDLDAVQRIRKCGGGTVNDVLIAMVAGMLRRWMSERGEDVTDVVPRALVPVARRRGQGPAGGNRLSGYLAELPVADPDPAGRLRAVRGVMDRNKAAGPGRGAGAAVLLTDYMLPMASRLGAPLAGHAVRLLFDILVTSVPVPDLGFTVGGCPLLEVYPLAPLARGQSLAVAMTTYRGRVHVGLVGDGEAAPDLGKLADAAHAELAAMARRLPEPGPERRPAGSRAVPAARCAAAGPRTRPRGRRDDRGGRPPGRRYRRPPEHLPVRHLRERGGAYAGLDGGGAPGRCGAVVLPSWCCRGAGREWRGPKIAHSVHFGGSMIIRPYAAGRQVRSCHHDGWAAQSRPLSSFWVLSTFPSRPMPPSGSSSVPGSPSRPPWTGPHPGTPSPWSPGSTGAASRCPRRG